MTRSPAPNRTLHEHGRVDTDFALVGVRHTTHDVRVGLRRLWIQRDHLAAGIAFQHGQLGLLADLESSAHPRVLVTPSCRRRDRRRRLRGIAACRARPRPPGSTASPFASKSATPAGSRSSARSERSKVSSSPSRTPSRSSSSSRGSSTARIPPRESAHRQCPRPDPRKAV